MKKYQVTLTRAYVINVHAKNIEDAKRLVEFFIGDPPDRSNKLEREKYEFKIGEMEMRMNEAVEADEYQEI